MPNVAAESAAYAEIEKAGYDKRRAGHVEIDPFLSGAEIDRRLGLTLTAFPPSPVTDRLSACLADVKRLCPQQYIYPAKDLHLTILSLISGTSDHTALQENLPDYIETVTTALVGTGSFDIAFRGITASAGAIILKGYVADDRLNVLRQTLRGALKQKGLDHYLDRRYRAVTAHMTLARFRDSHLLLEKLPVLLQRWSDHLFGQWRVDRLDLLTADWYMRAASRVPHRRYLLADWSPGGR